MRLLQPHLVKKASGLLKKENRKSARACAVQVSTFGLELLTVWQMRPATFVVGKASVIVRAEGRDPR